MVNRIRYYFEVSFLFWSLDICLIVSEIWVNLRNVFYKYSFKISSCTSVALYRSFNQLTVSLFISTATNPISSLFKEQLSFIVVVVVAKKTNHVKLKIIAVSVVSLPCWRRVIAMMVPCHCPVGAVSLPCWCGVCPVMLQPCRCKAPYQFQSYSQGISMLVLFQCHISVHCNSIYASQLGDMGYGIETTEKQ